MISVPYRLLAALFAVGAAGCTSDAALPGAAGPVFDPVKFFSGHTHGDGELKKLFGAPIRVSVDSVGHMEQGTLVLDQTIEEGGKAPTRRQWTIRRVGVDQYSGTLTDAVGEVRARVTGPDAYIRYTMRHGLIVDQQLALQNDGTTVLNQLIVRKFGARVAKLSETIRKVDVTR